MEENAITTTQSPEDMMADLVVKAMWLVFVCMTVGVFVLIETLLLNRGCSL